MPGTDTPPEVTESESSVCREGDNTLDAATPTITCKWSKKLAPPDHNANAAAQSLTNGLAPRVLWVRDTDNPTGDIPVPDECAVQAIVELTNVPDGADAVIEVFRCGTNQAVTDGMLAGLTTQGGKVVDPFTGEPPVLAFQAAQAPWDPWDKPFFYFKASVDFMDLKGESEKDSSAKPEDCLRIAFWVVALAGAKDLLPDTLNECNDLVTIVTKIAHCKATSRDHDGRLLSLAQLGSEIRNTYVYIQSSHGNVYKRSDGTPIDLDAMGDPPDKADPAIWRSAISATSLPGRVGDVQVRNTDDIVSVPRYLFYASTCLTGWEPTFSKAMIERGCMYVMAFRRTIPNSEAPVLSKKFFTLWADTYKMDPAKIPDCFDQVAPDHYKNMRPVLFSASGEKRAEPDAGLSALAIVGIIVAAVVVGALVAVAVASLF